MCRTLLRWLIFLCLFSSSFPANCQKTRLMEGDFLFLDLDCGGLCDAIEAVTEACCGKDFSHLGLIERRGDSVFVLEAMGNSVRATPLAAFLAYSEKPAVHARLKKKYNELIPAAVDFCRKQTGKAYDDAFLPDNGKFYCSELVYEAFRESNGGKAFFELQPMTFRQPGSSSFFPVWKEYYQKLGMPVPEGLPGCNPGGISRSDYLEIMGEYNPSQSLKQ